MLSPSVHQTFVICPADILLVLVYAARQVSEQYLVEERSNGLAKKSLCLTPRRKRKIKHLVEQELERFDV
jgi:hypothetical protein